MSEITWPRGHLEELSPEECWSALARHQVGRLVWHADNRPHIVPVNFTTRGESIYLRTTPYGEIARALAHRLVAFEVDDIEAVTRSGTSVVAIGVAEPAEDLPRDLADLDTWVDGTRSLIIRIEPSEITGRRLMPS